MIAAGVSPVPSTVACSAITWITTADAVVPAGGAVRAPAAAAQPVRSGGQRAEAVGASLGQGARITVADGVGQGGEPVGHRVPVGGVHGGHDLGQPVADVADAGTVPR